MEFTKITEINVRMLLSEKELASLDSEVAAHNAIGGEVDRAGMLAILLGIRLAEIRHERRKRWLQGQQWLESLARINGFTMSKDQPIEIEA